MLPRAKLANTQPGIRRRAGERRERAAFSSSDLNARIDGHRRLVSGSIARSTTDSTPREMDGTIARGGVSRSALVMRTGEGGGFSPVNVVYRVAPSE